MTSEQKKLLEELRDLAVTIEDVEAERAATPVEQREYEALMLEARRLRRAGAPHRASAPASGSSRFSPKAIPSGSERFTVYGP